MKKYGLALLALGMVAIAGAQGPYLRLDGGYALLNDSDVSYSGTGGSGSGELSYEDGYLLEGAFGWDLKKSDAEGGLPLRAELAIGYQKNKWDKWTEPGFSADLSHNSTEFWNFMLNGYWDIHNSSIFTPYLLGGIGFTRADIEHDGNDYDDTVFAGQLGGGIDVEVAENIGINLQYRYWMGSDIEFGNSVETDTVEISSHQFLIGTRVSF